MKKIAIEIIINIFGALASFAIIALDSLLRQSEFLFPWWIWGLIGVVIFECLCIYVLTYKSRKARKVLQFYTFDEHTDYKEECIKIGMNPIPLKGENPKLFIYKEHKYIVLNESDCYTGWKCTVMRLPQMEFDQLYSLAIHTKNYSERIGAIGIILKYYQDDFIDTIKKEYYCGVNTKQIYKICKIIYTDISLNSDEVAKMSSLLDLCYEVYSVRE